MATDEKFRNSVASVAQTTRPNPQAALEEQEKQDPVPAKAGVKRQVSSSSRSGGIASPLTEVGGSRVYQQNYTELTSSDGILKFRIKRLIRAEFKDAFDNSVVVNYTP